MRAIKRRFPAIIAALAAMTMAVPAAAANLVVNAQGVLTGATGVIVDGASYDVTFSDGSCFSDFDTCYLQRFGGFGANTTLRSKAAQALLDQVFVGAYDDDPGLTYGCVGKDGFGCFTLVPWEESSNTNTKVFVAWNSPVESVDSVYESVTLYDLSLADQKNYNWAHFAPSAAAAVPEPSTWALMLVGFGAIGGAMRRGRRTSFRRHECCTQGCVAEAGGSI